MNTPCPARGCVVFGDEPCVLCDDDEILWCFSHLTEAEAGNLCKPHAMGAPV